MFYLKEKHADRINREDVKLDGDQVTWQRRRLFYVPLDDDADDNNNNNNNRRMALRVNMTELHSGSKTFRSVTSSVQTVGAKKRLWEACHLPLLSLSFFKFIADYFPRFPGNSRIWSSAMGPTIALCVKATSCHHPPTLLIATVSRQGSIPICLQFTEGWGDHCSSGV